METATLEKPQTVEKTSTQTASKKEVLRVIPLGGLGEIGKNMMAYEYENDIIVVDMGFMFPEDEMLGVDYVIPDISYLEDKKERIKGIFITHAHEDHVGGIPYLWSKISAPIYGTKLTIGMIQNKVKEFKISEAAGFRTIEPEKDILNLGNFKIEFFRVNHSIPDAIGLAIRTPLGILIHTGDFKFDHTPVDKKTTNFSQLARYGKEGVLALLSDSTNSEVPGYTMSEKGIEENFYRIFESVKGRIIVASFASLINRIQQVINAAVRSNRKVAISGRSMLNNVDVAVKLGYLSIPQGILVRIQDVIKLPDNEVTILSTGSQGEAMSALSRMASGEHPQIKIKKGDTVILSSSPIPGNEKSINDTIDDLYREGARVVREGVEGMRESRVHVSGHAGQEEQKLMIDLTKPKYFIPIHGEYHHLVHHADSAADLGIPEENIFVIENGEVVEFTPQRAYINGKVPSGFVLVDGLGIGDVQNIVLRDRKVMSSDGIFVAICTVDKNTGELLTSPDIISRGFIYMRESEELVQNARNFVKKTLKKRAGSPPSNWSHIKSKLRDEIGEFLYQQTQRRPMVIPVIIEV